MIAELKAAKRGALGKGLSALRAEGKMPAVVYGPKQESMPIEIVLRDFSKVLDSAGESTVINLVVDGEGHNVLIHDVDVDPVTSIPRHADFYAIVKGQKVKVHVQLEFTGESGAVKSLGANLVKALHEIEVEADPMNLPHEIIVDISVLTTLDSQILAEDLKLPDGVVLVTKPGEVIATAVAAVEEKLDEPVAGPDMSAIEASVERGKAEEEAPLEEDK